MKVINIFVRIFYRLKKGDSFEEEVKAQQMAIVFGPIALVSTIQDDHYLDWSYALNTFPLKNEKRYQGRN